MSEQFDTPQWFDEVENAILEYGHACVDLENARLYGRTRHEVLDRRDECVKRIWKEVEHVIASHSTGTKESEK